MHIYRIKTGAMECCCHFNMGVNPLLTQHRHFRTCALGNVRRCNVFFWREAQFDVQARIAFILLGLVLLIGTLRVITQALHRQVVSAHQERNVARLSLYTVLSP